MVDLLLVLLGCFAMILGVLMLLLSDPSHESCKQEVRK